MSSAIKQEEKDDLDNRVKQAYLAFRCVDDPEEARRAAEEISKISKAAKYINEAKSLDPPRRGAHWEHGAVLASLERLLPGLSLDDVVPNLKSQKHHAKLLLENWREAECLALSPHSMSRLKQLPELQQIIAHTTLDAIHAAAGTVDHIVLVAQSEGDHRQMVAAATDPALSDLDPADPDWKRTKQEAAALIAAGKPRARFSGFRRTKEQLRAQDSKCRLYQQLAPALRLCLAAEVAVGMLCPGQPPPPDTPEHAAALQMFVAEATKHVEYEILQGPENRVAPTAGAEYDTAAAVRALWSHVTDAQSGSIEEASAAIAPPLILDIPKWGLAPHMDLQMQVPPHQQLQLFCRMMTADGLLNQQQRHHHCHQQQQQQRRRQEEAMRPLAAAAATDAADAGASQGDSSSAHQHMVQDTSAAAAAAAVAAADAQQPSSNASASTTAGLPFDIAQLSTGDLLSLDRLACQLLKVLIMQHSSDDSSSSSSSTAERLLHGVTQLFGAEAAAAALAAVEQQYSDLAGEPEWTADALTVVLLQTAASEARPAATTTDSGNARRPTNSSSTVRKERLGHLMAVVGGNLIRKFMADQWQSCGCTAAAPAWQQAVPLQVLLLFGQLDQIFALVQECSDAMASQQTAALQQQQQQRSDLNGQSSSTASPQQQQQQHGGSARCLPLQPEAPWPDHTVLLLLSKVQGMVQAIRAFTIANKTLHQARAPDQGTAGHAVHNGALHDAAAAAASMEPERFFAAGGPLASGLLCAPHPTGSGIWTQLDNNSSNKTGISLEMSLQQQQQRCASHGSGGVTDQQQQRPQQGQQQQQRNNLHKLVWQVLFATGSWTFATNFADQVASGELQSDSFTAAAARHSQQAAIELCHTRRNRSNWSGSMKGLEALDEGERIMFAASKLCDQLVEAGVDVSQVGVVGACAASMVCSKLLQSTYQRLFQETGIISRKARRSEARHKERQFSQLSSRLQEIDGNTRMFLLHEDTDRDFCMTSDEEDEESRIQKTRESWGSSDSSSSSASEDSDDWDKAESSSAARCTNELKDRRKRRAQISTAQQAYRQLANALTSQLAPLYNWHMAWLQNHQQKTAEARQWWDSATRQQLALCAATQKRLPGWVLQRLPGITASSGSSNGGGSSSSSVQNVLATGKSEGITPAAAAETVNGATPASSSGGSRSSTWTAGPCDYNTNCPLCRQEQQQQQQPSHPSSSSSSVYSRPAVPYTDPFMWRRLLWQLLGKLSPEAQAFYAHYLAVCPHCSDDTIWEQCVQQSISHALWTPPEFDAVDLQLAAPLPRQDNVRRALRVQQYATALNTGFAQGHLPGLVPLAHHLLLSLSPLHAQVLPRPEVALLCPSSFPACVGKALQQQLLSRPVLDLFQHHSAALQIWHVWWHIGVRRYAEIKQQEEDHGVPQQQQQQQQHWRQTSVDELYMNPDARVYAVSFAMRQLCNGQACSDEEAATLGHLGSPTTYAALQQAVTQIKRMLLLEDLQEEPAGQSTDEHLSSCQRSAGPDSQAAGPDSQAALALQQVQLLSDAEQQQLQQAAAWPRDMLAPARVRHDDANRDITHHKRLVNIHLNESLADILALTEDDTEQQQQQQQRRPAWADKMTDVSLLALQPPVPVDAFVDPELWFCRQQQLLDLDRTCAACGNKENVEMVICTMCNTARYCNDGCQQKDAARHSVMCERLHSALLRYGADPFPGLCGLLQCSPCDIQPWGVDCRRLTGRLAEPLLTREVFVQRAGEALLLQQLSRGRAISEEE